MSDVMEVVVCDWRRRDVTTTKKQQKLQPIREQEMGRPDWFKMKWWEGLGIMMSQFHMKVENKATLNDDITAGRGRSSMHPPNMSPLSSSNVTTYH